MRTIAIGFPQRQHMLDPGHEPVDLVSGEQTRHVGAAVGGDRPTNCLRGEVLRGDLGNPGRGIAITVRHRHRPLLEAVRGFGEFGEGPVSQRRQLPFDVAVGDGPVHLVQVRHGIEQSPVGHQCLRVGEGPSDVGPGDIGARHARRSS